MIGLQLYTVRALTGDEEGARKTVRALKQMGYECVQLAGGIEDVERTANACLSEGMPVIGILTDMDICEQYTQRLFDIAKACGAKDLGISAFTTTDEQTVQLLDRANAFNALAQANGFTFSYHNHSLEFIRCASGKRVIDYVCENFEGYLMPDTYWLQHGGADVRDFIFSHGERVKILHLKDMKRVKEGVTFAEIGNGNINFAGVIECAKEKGIGVFIVEQDESEDALVSAKISIDNLRKLI